MDYKIICFILITILFIYTLWVHYYNSNGAFSLVLNENVEGLRLTSAHFKTSKKCQQAGYRWDNSFNKCYFLPI